VAADAAGYADGTDDVAGKADVAETITCQRRARSADVSGDTDADVAMTCLG